MPYVTLDDFKTFLGEQSETYDAELRAALAAAETMADRYMGRSLGSTRVTESIYGADAPAIWPKRTPITGVTSCLVDGSAVEVTFGPAWVRRKDGGLFRTRQVISLTYTGGVATIPDDVKTAVKITAQAVWGAGDLDANMTGENLGGVLSAGYQPGGPGSLPRAAQTILAPYRRVVI